MTTKLLALGFLSFSALATGCGDDTTGTGGAGGASTSADATSASGTTSAADATSSADGSGGASSSSAVTVVSSTATGGATQCGEEPYVDAHIVVTSYVSKALVEGAELTVNLCPGLTLSSNAEGELDASIAQDQAFQARFVADGHLPMRLGEQLLTEAFEADVPLFPTLATAILPDWGDDRPSMMVLIDVHADEFEEDDPCATAEGWEVTAVDHAEAIVTYYEGDSFPNPNPDLEATGPLGLAAFSGMDATDGDASLTFTASKDGCDDASFDSYPFTGGHSLENGVLTVAVGRVPERAPR